MHAILYHAPHCPACRRLSGDCASRGVQHQDVCAALERAAALGIRQLPALVVDGRVLAQGAAVVDALRRLPVCG